MPNRSPDASRADLISWLRQVSDRRDHRAFARLFRFLAPRLKTWLHRRTMFNPSRVDDVVQDVMLEVWLKASKFDPDKAAPTTWVFAIARHRMIDLLRRDRASPSGDAEELAGHADSPERLLLLSQDIDRLEFALRDIPEAQAFVVRQTYLRERTFAELASETRTPIGTLKRRARLAIVKLQDRLTER